MIGDSFGYNTFFGPRGSSTIDSIIVSEDLFYEFDFINVSPPSELSDHCVVWCCFKTYSEIDEEPESLYDKLPGKFIVDETTKQKYIESLVDDQSCHLLQTFSTNVDNNDIGVDTLTDQFVNIIHLSAAKSA